MNKSLIFPLAVMVVTLAGIWYWSTLKSDDVVVYIPAPQTIVESPATRVYKDDTVGFSITFPSALSSTTNDSQYLVESSYTYPQVESGVTISGVKFTIPRDMATGTNLSRDSYLSVEHLEKGQECDAAAFMGVSGLESNLLREGIFTYSFASSSEAAAGNRYEEYVYAMPDSDPCVAVRYFVHYGAIENYDSDTVKAFDRAKLLADFDAIRKSLIIQQ